MTPVQVRVPVRNSADAALRAGYKEPRSGRFLSFIERHETLVQLLPFFLAATLLLLSLVSQQAAGIVQLLDVTKTK